MHISTEIVLGRARGLRRGLADTMGAATSRLIANQLAWTCSGRITVFVDSNKKKRAAYTLASKDIGIYYVNRPAKDVRIQVQSILKLLFAANRSCQMQVNVTLTSMISNMIRII